MSELANPLPRGWVLTVLSKVGSVQLGLQKSASRQTGRWRTKYLRSVNISSHGLDLRDVAEMDFTPAERNLYRLIEGDLVVVEASGSPAQLGRAAMWRGELPLCCFWNHLIRFRPHATTPEFALVVFRHHAVSGVLARVARGIGIQHLGRQRFAQVPFPLPPLSEQKRIATAAETRLDELREAASALQSALRLIEEQNREILSTAVAGALVPSEASAAAAEGRDFDDAATLFHSLRGGGEEQTSLLDSTNEVLEIAADRGALSDGWVWCRVGEAGEVRIGRQLSPQQRQGPNLRKYLRVANVYEDYIDVSDVKQMNFTPEEFEIYKLHPGDILLNEGQSLELVGRPAMFRGEIPDVCFQNTLIRFRAASGVNPDYALLVFRHYLHSGKFSKVARRSTNIAHLGLARFSEMPFPLPPQAEQDRIAEEAHRRLAASKVQADSVRAALARLPEMEREILEAAVTGTLVPQEDQDEPAEMLLARLGLPPSPAASSGQELSEIDEEASASMATTNAPGTIRSLPDVLREVGRPVPLPELFAMAGYERDSVADVERFYLALRTELGKAAIRVLGESGENATVEATDAA